jgi:adenylate kinase
VEQEERKQAFNQREQVERKCVGYCMQKERELEQVQNFPFRNYLMDFVVPVLNEGLVEVSHILPDDPVEFLAEYLYKKSFEVDKEEQ